MLCHCITPANRSQYGRQIEEMFQQRHAVFVDGMGWRELRRGDQRDIDEYDTDDTVYLLVLDDGGQVMASTRMNPTWGRHQLEDGGELRQRFAHMKPPSGPRVWEGSRLLGGLPDKHGKDVARATLAILLAGVQEFCIRRAVEVGISILEARVISRVQDLGWDIEPLGLPVRYETDRGPGEAQASIWRTGMKYLVVTRERTGVRGPVLFESGPVEVVDANTAPNFALLDMAAALGSERQQAEALRAMRAILAESGQELGGRASGRDVRNLAS